MKENSAPLGSK